MKTFCHFLWNHLGPEMQKVNLKYNPEADRTLEGATKQNAALKMRHTDWWRLLEFDP